MKTTICDICQTVAVDCDKGYELLDGVAILQYENGQMPDICDECWTLLHTVIDQRAPKAGTP